MTTLSDEQLLEEIKKVKIEKAKPKNWDARVEKRYLDYSITREGFDMMVEFIKTIGEGPIMLDTWYGMKRIRKAVAEAGFLLIKNKLKGGYGIFKKQVDVDTSSFTFNPELLDMDDVEESDENEKAAVGEPA